MPPAADAYRTLKARVHELEQPVHPAAVERLETFVERLTDQPDVGPGRAG